MTSTTAPSQVEMGLSSMTDYLAYISKGTDTGNMFLNSLGKDLFNFKENVRISLLDITKIIVQKHEQAKEMLFVAKTNTFLLSSIIDILSNNTPKNSGTQTITIQENTKKDENVSILKSIDISLKNIYTSLSSKKSIFPVRKINTESKIDNKPEVEKSGIFDNIMKFAETLVIIRKNLTDKLTKRTTKFLETFNNLVGTMSEYKVKIFGESMEKFGSILTDLDKKLKSPAKTIGLLAISFIGLSLAILSPTFVASLGILAGFLYIMSKISSDKELMPGMMNFGFGLIAMTASLLLMQNVSWDSVKNFLFFVGGLGLVLRLWGKEKTNSNLIGLGVGIIILVGAMMLMEKVSFESMKKLLIFIGGLGMTLKFFGGPLKSSLNGTGMTGSSNLMYVGLGIVALIFAMMLFSKVPTDAIYKVIGFLLALGIAIKFISGGTKGSLVNFNLGIDINLVNKNPMMQVAMGLALITLSLYAFSQLPISAMIGVIGFIFTLGIVIKMINGKSVGVKMSGGGGGLMSFAFGLGLMTLALLAFNELPIVGLIKMLVFLGGLGLVMKIFDFDKMGPKNSMFSFAFGLGILVLAMYAIDELPWEAMFKTLVFIGGLGLVLKLFKGTEIPSIIGLSFGILVLSGAMYVFKKIGWTLNDSLVFGISVAGIAGIVALMGIPVVAAAIKLGTIALIGLSAGLIVAGLSLALVSKLNINNDNLLSFGIGSTLLVMTFALLTPFTIIGLVGAIAFLPIAVAALISATALKVISEIGNYDLTSYSIAVKGLVSTFASLGLSMLVAVPLAIAFIPVAVSALIGAVVLRVISALEINTDNITKYGLGVNLLVESINEVGAWNLVKVAAKSVLLLPIFASALLGGLTLRLISGLDIDKNKILIFGESLSSFTTVIAETLSQNEDKLKKAQPGIRALTQLLNISGGLARTIQLMANMNFYEYTVKDGKLVLSGVRKLTDDDFKRVGNNLGTMLECLINPLTILGSSSNKIVIGDKVIDNPFKSSTALKGIDMLANIGNAFKPLAEAVKTYSSMPMVSNPSLLNNFTNSLLVVINTFNWVFERLEKIPVKNSANVLDLLDNFVDTIEKFNTEKITSLGNVFEKFVNILSDDIKWRKIQINLNMVKKEFKDIAKSINSIDINKATMFERNFKNLVDKNNAQNLNLIVENLTELLNLTKQNTETNTQISEKSNNNGFSFNNQQETQKQTKTKTQTQQSQNKNDDFASIVSVLSDIASKIGITNTKLDTLKVRVVNGNINSL